MKHRCIACGKELKTVSCIGTIKDMKVSFCVEDAKSCENCETVVCKVTVDQQTKEVVKEMEERGYEANTMNTFSLVHFYLHGV